MKLLLGTDFVLNDMTLPGGQDHPGLSFDAAYKTFEAALPILVRQSPSNGHQIPTPMCDPKRKRLEGNSFIMFTPSTMSTPVTMTNPAAMFIPAMMSTPVTMTNPAAMSTPPTTSTPATMSTPALATSSAITNEVGKGGSSAPNHEVKDDDDNEEALAKKLEKPPKAAVKLLPQEVPPFKPYVEPINPLALSHFKHRSIDLPVTYMSDLPAKVMKRPSMWVGKAGDKLQMVADEWDQYLKDRTPMSAESKNLITKYASILPRALTYSREVALYILTTSHGNIICPYHRWVSKKLENDIQFETHVPNHYFVTGVPGISRIKRLIKRTKEVVSKVVEVGKFFIMSGEQPVPPTANKDAAELEEEDKPLERKPGELHCGCIEDEVLLELILWKTTLQQSPSTGIVETWQDAFLHPRDRTFVLRAHTFWAGLTADKLYEYDADGNHRDIVDITQYQIAYLTDRLERAKNDREDLSGIIPGIKDMEMVSFDDDEEEGEGQGQVEGKKESEGMALV
ncbi:hypothetical protein NP233_g12719 [Leucocoprinus birnbaumii]|uniref:Uncharacterized protein n=1 Tax=Leucocoprinus birnbaumii TaxID=56174 RepID=A0AAD5YJ82_9AGAR|nr:hypothetical protein NP233_g12719 [Leucocoprinus birnbaumii]